MSRRYTVILGAIQFGDEPSLTPIVCLDCPDKDVARDLAALILKVQNGERTMAQQEEVFRTGDTAVKVEVHRHPARPKEAVLATVRAKAGPGHLTEAFYAGTSVDADPVQLFRFFQQLSRQYVLTVSVDSEPLCELLYLVKHQLVWRSPVEPDTP